MPFTFYGASEDKGITNLTIQPLTRDGGAKLKTENPLLYSIISGSEGDYKFYLD